LGGATCDPPRALADVRFISPKLISVLFGEFLVLHGRNPDVKIDAIEPRLRDARQVARISGGAHVHWRSGSRKDPHGRGFFAYPKGKDKLMELARSEFDVRKR
jgi:hypothetical protein